MNTLLVATSAILALGGTIYERYNRAFDQGEPASYEMIYGWTAGRCVSKSHADDATAGLLVTWVDAERVLKSFLLYHSPGQVADEHYDVLTPELAAEIREMIEKWGDGIPPLLQIDGDWVGTHENGAQMTLRRSQDSVIAVGGDSSGARNLLCDFHIPLDKNP